VIEPKVSIITSLSYDHMHLLGESLSDIAREKAGIIKSGVPVVSAPQQYEADRVVETIAHERGAPLVRVGRDWLFTPLRHDLSGQTLSIWSAAEQPLMDVFVESAGEEEWAPPRYRIPLLGYHQVINAAVAYAALQELKMQGVKVSEEAIQQGFQQVSWPGRFQILSQDPMLVVDSAHNRDSALKLRIALDEYFPGRPVRVIFGASTDKDIRGMLAELSPRVSRFIATQAVHPRALEAEQLGALARGYGLPTQIVVPVEKALLQALHDLGPEGVVLATGSLFVVGEVLSAWREQSEDLQPGIGEGVR
jgi:dihydrofolate synthase/folylpolyglutamate synthase